MTLYSIHNFCDRWYLGVNIEHLTCQGVTQTYRCATRLASQFISPQGNNSMKWKMWLLCRICEKCLKTLKIWIKHWSLVGKKEYQAHPQEDVKLSQVEGKVWVKGDHYSGQRETLARLTTWKKGDLVIVNASSFLKMATVLPFTFLTHILEQCGSTCQSYQFSPSW